MHMRIGMAPSAGVLMGCFAVSLGALAPPALAQVTDTPVPAIARSGCGWRCPPRT
ncbi:hypothetical protein HML84_22070 [Alcanivorax sp. IO_7]|nr:hypothetical protein HML84_22070 [Alcanivorax sp. IO_7]